MEPGSSSWFFFNHENRYYASRQAVIIALQPKFAISHLEENFVMCVPALNFIHSI